MAHDMEKGFWRFFTAFRRLQMSCQREEPEGRSGENIGAWTGFPIELGPRKEQHRAIAG